MTSENFKDFVVGNEEISLPLRPNDDWIPLVREGESTKRVSASTLRQTFSVDMAGPPERPGDAVSLYGAAFVGEPSDIVVIDPEWVTISDAGNVVRVVGGVADNPQIIAPISIFPIEQGFIYGLRWKVQRQVDPIDPVSDQVLLAVVWLDNNKEEISTTIASSLPLVVSDGVVQLDRRVSITDGPEVDIIAPFGTIYCRPYIEIQGINHSTDVIVVEFISAQVSSEFDALVLYVKASDLSGQVVERPGDAVSFYGTSKIGPATEISAVDTSWVATSSEGSVVRVNSTFADDPQTIAPIFTMSVESDRVYEIRWKVQRQTDPADPVSNSVALGIQWLNGAKGDNGTTVIENIELVIADGVRERFTRFAFVASMDIEHVAPSGTVYYRPYVDCFGNDHVTDVIVIEQRLILGSIAPLTLRDFGVVGDDDVDDIEAVQAAMEYAKVNSKIIIAPTPPVKYKVTDEINMFLAAPASPWGLVGEVGWAEPVFKCYFNGYNKAVFNGDSPVYGSTVTNEGRGQGPVQHNIRVEFDESVTQYPIGFSYQRVGNLELNNYSVQRSNNVQVRLSNLTNSICGGVVAFGGGWAYIRKSTTGVTFDIVAGATTLISSVAHFSVDDEGEHLHVTGGNNEELFVIVTVTDDQHAEVAKPANRNFTAAVGGWEPAKANLTAGSPIVTSIDNVPIFTEDNSIKRELLFVGADVDGGVHRAMVIGVLDDHTIEMDRNAVTSVAETEFGCAAVLFGGRAGSYEVTNDFQHGRAQIEHFAGFGLATLWQTRTSFPEGMKIHGQPLPATETPSIACVLNSHSKPHFDYLNLDSNTVGPGRIMTSAGLGTMTINRIDTNISQGEVLICERNSGNDGFVRVETINISNVTTTQTRQGLFDNEDDAVPKISVGRVNGLNSANEDFPAEVIKGLYKGWYEILPPFIPFFGGSINDGNLTYAVQSGSGFRFGELCWIQVRIKLSGVIAHPSGTTRIKGLPYEARVRAGGYPMTVGSVLFNLVTAGAWVVAEVARFEAEAGAAVINLTECADSIAPLDFAGGNAPLRADSEINLSGLYRIAL